MRGVFFSHIYVADSRPYRLQAVQQYTHEDQNPDKIKLRAFQIASPITEAQINMRSKVFKICPSQLRSFKIFSRGSVGYLKITKDKGSDASLTSTDLVTYA